MEYTSLETEQQSSIVQTLTPPTGYSRADLHMHTNLGDGWASPARIIEVAIARGLDLIAVTDHDHVEGAQRVADLLAKGDYPLRMIPGVEVSTRQGHLLGLFVKKAPKHMRPVEESIDAIKEQGGLVIVPHPFGRLVPSLSRAKIETLLAKGYAIDGTVRSGGQDLPSVRLSPGIYVAQCAWSWFVDPPRRIMRRMREK